MLKRRRPNHPRVLMQPRPHRKPLLHPIPATHRISKASRRPSIQHHDAYRDYTEFIEYFSEWRHAKILIGTCMSWFLVDIAYALFSSTADSNLQLFRFYGINLNQNVVLTQIGFGGKDGTPWERLFKVATGNLIVTALGFVPGELKYYSLDA